MLQNCLKTHDIEALKSYVNEGVKELKSYVNEGEGLHSDVREGRSWENNGTTTPCSENLLQQESGDWHCFEAGCLCYACISL